MSFISLLVICSASWSIKHIKKSDVEKFTVDEEIYSNIDDDTSIYFSSEATYNSQAQEPVISDDAASTFYNMSAEEAVAAKKYTAIWQTGTYLKEVDGSLTIQPKSDGSHKKYAGTHYYRIVDTETGTVICYKHAYTIAPSEVTASEDVALGEKFTGDTVSYTVTWEGETESKEVSFNGKVSKLMSDRGKSFGDYPYFVDTIEYDPSVEFADNELFLNNHTFDDEDKVNVTYTALATAYSTDGSNKTHYGTIVDALNTTYSTNTTVVALQSFTSPTKTYTAGSILEIASNGDIKKTIQGDYYHKIDKDCDVASNVTLLIPYDTDMSYYDASSRTYTAALVTTKTSGSDGVSKSAYDNVDADGKPIYLKNSILVTKGTTLTNNGNIIIPGIITGGSGGSSIASVTAKDHSRINLANNASIVNAASTANITCYGYIDELGDNTKVEIATGNLNVVFSIVEHRGGAIFLAMGGGIGNAFLGNYKIKDSSPFNRFYVESVTSQIEVTEGATVKGYYNVYVQDHIDGNIGFFGVGSDYFVGFNSSDEKISKAFLKYDPENDRNELTIQGNASINKLDVKVEMSGVSLPLSTQDVYLPLSHYWNLSFQRFNGNGDAATVTATGQDIKIMPGATLMVEEGVTFKAKNIAVYTKTSPPMGNAGSFDYFAKADEDATSTFVATEASTYVDGSLVVGGSLELNGGLGGYVSAQGNNATLKIGSTSVSVKEIATTSGTGTNGEVTYTDLVTLAATGPVATSDNSSSTAGLGNTGTYTSINGAWFKPYATITLNANGGVAGDTSVELPVNKQSGVTNQTNLLNAAKPTWSGHTFVGWYLDEACTKAFNAVSVKYDTTLYAKWTLDATVNFVTNGGTAVSPVSVAISSTGISQADLAKIKGAISSKTNHNFVAWCVDEGLTTEVTAEWFAGKGSAITLYAMWEEVETYRVDLNMGELDGRTDLFNISYVEAPMGTVLTLPSVSNIDGTITEQRYFLGWAITSDGDVVSNIKIDNLTLPEGKDTYTLYAKWGTKVTVTFNASEYTKLITLLGDKVKGDGVESIYLKPGATYDVTSFGNYQYLDDANPLLDYESYFDGAWVVSNGITITDNVITVGSDVQDGTEVTLKPEWKTKYAFKTETTNATITITVTATVGGTENTYTYSSNTTYYAVPGTKIVGAVSYNRSSYKYAGVVGYDATVKDSTGLNGNATSVECTIDSDKAYKLHATSGTNTCLAAGTLVTLADGTQKKIEDVLITDKLLVFDHETGKFVVGEIMLIETHDGWNYYNIINARFSNGTVVRIINEHGFFDLTLNKYVYITEENYEQFIGHEFAVVDGEKFESVTLEEVFITTEHTGIYNIVTKYHLNCISDGLLSISGAIEGTFNIFEYDENLKYDEDKMAKDIEKYGLFTYDDFAEHVPKEVFDMFPAQYFKVSIGKGYTTYEKLLALANEYLVKHGYYTPNN